MVHACCAYGCSNKFKKGDGLGFFRFPYNDHRRFQWILAVKRKNFIPNESTRICGAHFQTGRPSRDINHPDYVPNIFAFNEKNFDLSKYKKKKTLHRKYKKELLTDINELPFINSIKEEQDCEVDDPNYHSKSVEGITVPDILQEFIQNTGEASGSPVIDKNTVEHVLAKDFINNPSAIPDKYTVYGKKRFPPQKFTFIDLNGKVIAKYSEKRLRINTPLQKKRLHPVFSSHTVKQTVQVILDRKSAKTAFVDVDLIPGYVNSNNLRRREDMYDYDSDVTDTSDSNSAVDIDYTDISQEMIANDYENVKDGTDNSNQDFTLNVDFIGSVQELKEEIIDDDFKVADDCSNNSNSFCFNTIQPSSQQPHTIRIRSANEDALESGGEKTDEDLFSWYSELRTLNNRSMMM